MPIDPIAKSDDRAIGEAEPVGIAPNPAASKREAKESLCQRFGLAGEFIRAGQVAVILGVGARTIRAMARDGACPIAHRRFGRSLLFKLDDFMDWYCEEAAGSLPREEPARARLATTAAKADTRQLAPSRDTPAKPTKPTLVPPSETPAQRSERIGREVRAAMAERRRAQAYG